MPADSRCPSCGRFVGPYPRCPICGADVGQRMAIRVFRYASLAVGILGLAVLLFVARRSQAPAIEIGDLRGTMNWAYVRIEGLVTRQPSYDAEAQTLRFWLDDGTGEIMVMAYRPEAEWLVGEGLVPWMGDQVALEGTLRIKEDFQYLILDVPQHTEVQSAEPAALPIAQVTGDRRYQKVTVRGVIREDRAPYEGLRILTLRDATGEIEAAVYCPAERSSAGAPAIGLAALAGEVPELRPGQAVQVTGAVDLYQGAAQISVGRGSDVVALDEPPAIASERRTGAVSASDVGEMVWVEGAIAEVDPFSAGIKATLDDGSGPVTLLLWQDLYDGLADPGALVRGATVRVQGEVAEYRGELEIVPGLPMDVAVVQAAEPMAFERRLGELSAADLGQEVRVWGVLRSVEAFSAGVKGMLDDGTGTLTLLLWQEVYDGLADPGALVAGVRVLVQGEIDEYRGALEIVPRAPGDLEVTGVEQVAAVPPTLAATPGPDAGAGETPEAGLTATPRIEFTTSPTASPTAILTTTPPAGTEPTTRPTPTPRVGTASTPGVGTTPTPGVGTTPTPGPTVETRSVGAISGDDVGRTLTIAQAGITGVDYFSAGVKYAIRGSGGGTIVLLVWQNVMEEIPDRYDLFPGSQVRVTGEIEEYEGDLEIIPRQGADVEVLARGERPPIEARSIQNITPSDEGRIFTVEGQVTRTEGQGWLRMWIQDGTGEILVFVPTRTVTYLPAGLGPGVRLRVRGEVDIYQGVLEIIPLAGADFEVQ